MLVFWWEGVSFSLRWTGLFEVVCFGVSVGSLSAYVYVLVLLVVWARRPALGAAGSWVVLGLGFRWGPSQECSPINTPWGQEFSGGLVSWTQTPLPETQTRLLEPRSHKLIWQ